MAYAKVKENFKGKIHQLFCKQENRDGGNQSNWKIVLTTVWNSSNIYLPQVYNIHGTAQAENIFPIGMGVLVHIQFSSTIMLSDLMHVSYVLR